MMRATGTVILILSAMMLLIGGPSRAVANDNVTPNAETVGTYSIKVAGCATGTGKASSSGDKISLTASVTDESGNEGTLSADLAVDHKSHFAGKGTLLGQKVTLHGRLDAATLDDPAINAQRIVCTFTTADGQHGRIAGYVPDTAGSAGHKGGKGKDKNGDKGDD
jgi:hypothetical protein